MPRTYYMEQGVKHANLIDKNAEFIENRALHLICKKGYTREAVEKELKLNSSDLKVRIRKELRKYREIAINEH